MEILQPLKYHQTTRGDYVPVIASTSAVILGACILSGMLIAHHRTAVFMVMMVLLFTSAVLYLLTYAPIYLHLALLTGVLHYQIWMIETESPGWGGQVVPAVYVLLMTFDLVYARIENHNLRELQKDASFRAGYPIAASALLMGLALFSERDAGFLRLPPADAAVGALAWILFGVAEDHLHTILAARQADTKYPGVPGAFKCVFFAYTRPAHWVCVLPFAAFDAYMQLQGPPEARASGGE